MGNSTSSSDSCSNSSVLDLNLKSTLVNHHSYGSMYIHHNEHCRTVASSLSSSSSAAAATVTAASSTSSAPYKYHSNLNLSKKSKINKILKFISPANDSLKEVQKRDANKVKNRRSAGKNFITKSLIFFRTPSLKDKSPDNSLKCSTPLDFKFEMGAKSKSMYVDNDNLSAKFKTQLSLNSNKSLDKSSFKLNSSTDSKNDSGILSDYKRSDDHSNKVKSSLSTFSIGNSNQIESNQTNLSSYNRRLSINSTIDTQNQSKNKNVNIRRTTTFHTTTKLPDTNSSAHNQQQKQFVLNIPHQIQPLQSQLSQIATVPPPASTASQPLHSSQIHSNLKQESTKSKKIVVQASTSELLRCLTSYLINKYPYLIKADNEPLTSSNRLKADSREVISWLRSADRALLLQGWQEIAFMNPVNVVFVYLLIRDSLDKPKTVYELQCHVMSCLYLAFSYMGNEISYPLKPFLVEDERDIFWQRIVSLMNLLSTSMLRINQDARFFTELFYELKSYATQPALSSLNDQTFSIHKSVTINSFKSYNNDTQIEKQFATQSIQANNGRISGPNKPLVYSNSSKNMLKSPRQFRNTHRESCMYHSINDPPLFKPLAYCI